MIDLTNYFVFTDKLFTRVSEVQYNTWLSEEWNKLAPPLFSKIIGRVVYTTQAFYHRNISQDEKLKPFTIYYIEGNKHSIRNFRNWEPFIAHFEKLIRRVHEIEINQFRKIKFTGNKTSNTSSLAASGTQSFITIP